MMQYIDSLCFKESEERVSARGRWSGLLSGLEDLALHGERGIFTLFL